MAEVGQTRSGRHFARIMAEEWRRLTLRERTEAIEYAKLAGPMVALAWFGKVAEEQPPDSFGGVIPAGMDQFEDGSLIEGARQHGLPNPPFYIRFVVGTVCPEKLATWRKAWKRSPETVGLDPRVYHFSGAFERERCRIISEEEPPTDPESLQQLAWVEQEGERLLARSLFDWIFAVEAPNQVDTHDLRIAYRIQRARVDQFEMLVAAAEDGASHGSEGVLELDLSTAVANK
jgi:hypothetical protein